MDAYDEWCVKSNLRTIAEGADPKEIVETLKQNGYQKVATELEKQLNSRKLR